MKPWAVFFDRLSVAHVGVAMYVALDGKWSEAAYWAVCAVIFDRLSARLERKAGQS